MEIKKLKKLYEEYKKIGQPKGYSKGGEAKKHDQKNLKELKHSFDAFISEESNEKGYADGGDVSPEQKSAFQSIHDALFGKDATPSPTPTDLDKKNAAIRERNRTNASGETSPIDQPYSKGGQVIGYDDGGMVQPTLADNSVFAAGATDNAIPTQNNMNQFNASNSDQFNTDSGAGDASGTSGLSYLQKFLGSSAPSSGGGQSQDPNAGQNQQISQGLSKYYSGLGHFKGGKIKGYADGTSDGEPVQSDDVNMDAPHDSMDLGDIPINVAKDADLKDEEPAEDDKDAKLLKELAKEKEDAESGSTIEDEEADAEKAADEAPDSNKEDLDRELASDEPTDQEKADIEQSGFSGKAEGITPPSPGDPNALAKAQAQRQMMINGNTQLQLGNLIGSGIASRGGAKTEPLPPNYFDSLNRGANLPVQNIQEQIANQPNDPNSQVSKVVGDYLTKKGFNLPAGTSAADAFKVMPFLQKDQALQNAIQKVMMQQQGALQRNTASNTTKADIAEKNRAAAMQRQQVANEGKVKASVAGQQAKADKESRDAQVKAESDLTSTRGKVALQMAQRNMMSVKNAQKMLEEFPDTDKWTPSQVGLFNSEVAKIAQGGVPTEQSMNELSNPTAASSMAKLASSITNVPVGADQSKFIALNAKYLKGLGDVSQQTIRDNLGNTLKAYQDKLGPDAYKNLLYRHSDMLGLYTPQQEKGINAVMQAKGLSRQDAIKGLIQQGAIKDVNY
jgi:hypothetical protein